MQPSVSFLVHKHYESVLNYMTMGYFFHRSPSEGSIRWTCSEAKSGREEEVVCRTPASFLPKVRKCINYESGSSRKRKGTLRIKAFERHLSELDSVPNCA